MILARRVAAQAGRAVAAALRLGRQMLGGAEAMRCLTVTGVTGSIHRNAAPEAQTALSHEGIAA